MVNAVTIITSNLKCNLCYKFPITHSDKHCLAEFFIGLEAFPDAIKPRSWQANSIKHPQHYGPYILQLLASFRGKYLLLG